MQNAGKRSRLVAFTISALAGVVGLLALSSQSLAQDQPKPGPEHEKLRMWVGDWTYEGVGESTPFSPASGKFVGKLSCSGALGGFFVRGSATDTSEGGHVYENIWILGYDSAQKRYVFHTFVNDGTATEIRGSLDGRTWTFAGSMTDRVGKVYKTRMVNQWAKDGNSYTELVEYSQDDGNTWSTMYSMTAKKGQD
jgi:hypothetical protein